VHFRNGFRKSQGKWIPTEVTSSVRTRVPTSQLVHVLTPNIQTHTRANYCSTSCRLHTSSQKTFFLLRL